MPSIVALAWTALVLVVGPLAGIASRRKLARSMPSRLVAYAANGINLAIIAVITVAIDLWRGGQSVHSLITVIPFPRFVAWSVGMSVGCMGLSLFVIFLRGKFRRFPTATVMSLLPDNRVERTVFLAVCVLVGVVEEFLFRGFALATLTQAVRSSIAAVAIVTIAFGLAHGVQDAIGIIRAMVLGGLLAIPVLVTGSLLPSVIAHAVVDAFTGLFMRPLLERFTPPA
jgi:membrane protease YdiL (CAAX protease family)